MKRCSLIAALLALCVAVAGAMPYKPDLVDVPVDRMVANLEKRVAADPKNAHLQYLLARVHAIAYAEKSSKLVVQRGSEVPIGSTELPPWKVEPGTSPAQKRSAEEHLAQAVEHYKLAAKYDPASLAASLGYGWCLVQQGRKSDARVVLTDLYERAWRSESTKTSMMPFEPCMACEASKYLTPLLDPKKDAAFIARMREQTAKLSLLPRAVTPIIIPLEDVGFEHLIDRQAAVPFDLDASGRRLCWQWITPRAGWLVYLGRGLRAPSDGTRLLGARTFWIFWDNGYDALAAFDDDGDGQVSGDELDGLGVWRDANGNGIVDPGEILTLRQVGVVALSCRHVLHPDGFPYSPGGIRMSDGSVRSSYDWISRGR